MKPHDGKPSSSIDLSIQSSKIHTYLRLGRVSNLPTVWTNTISGVVLAGGSLRSVQLPFLCVAFTLFYAGGMFLNDAFDREADARTRPERPIPSGVITAAEVFGAGFSLMAAGGLIMILIGAHVWETAASAAALVAAIVGYDAYHKRNPLGPWLMGLCRGLIVLTAAVTVAGRINTAVVCGATALFLYVTGVSYLAKRQRVAANTIGRLIAGISLLDALLMAAHGSTGAACLAVLGCLFTLAWQRVVEGT